MLLPDTLGRGKQASSKGSKCIQGFSSLALREIFKEGRPKMRSSRVEVTRKPEPRQQSAVDLSLFQDNFKFLPSEVPCNCGCCPC